MWGETKDDLTPWKIFREYTYSDYNLFLFLTVRWFSKNSSEEIRQSQRIATAAQWRNHGLCGSNKLLYKR